MLLPRRCLQYGIRASRPRAIRSLPTRTFSLSQRWTQSVPPNADNTNAGQPALEYSQWKEHWDRIGPDGRKAAIKLFYEREKMATPAGEKSQLDIQKEDLTKQLKKHLQDIMQVARTIAEMAAAKSWIKSHMAQMLVPLTIAMEAGISEFPQDKRALTSAEISMLKIAFDQTIPTILETIDMQNVMVSPKLWDDIEAFLKPERKKEDLVVNFVKNEVFGKAVHIICLLARILNSAQEFVTNVDGPPLSASNLEIQLEGVIDLLRPVLLRYLTDEDFALLVCRAKALLVEISSAAEGGRWANQICLLKEDIQSDGRSASPAERLLMKENLAKLELQKVIYPHLFTGIDFEDYRAEVARFLGD